MTAPPSDGKKLDLTATESAGKQSDSHMVMSSQCCFLPIEKGKETKFSVALFNYQSKPKDPAVLVIVSTSKGTSAQIVEGQEQEMVFNNFGQKADFIGQRLTDNRIERNVAVHGAMTKQEKQDNVIVVIQVPLKQKPEPKPKPKPVHSYPSPSPFKGFGGANAGPWGSAPQYPQMYVQQQQQCQSYGGYGGGGGFGQPQSAPVPASFSGPPSYGGGGFGGGYVHQQSAPVQNYQNCSYQMEESASVSMLDSFNMSHSINMSGSVKKKKKRSMKKAKKQKAEVEAAIVKIAPKTIPVCVCGGALEKVSLSQCYPASQGGVSCDDCGETITAEGDNTDTLVWHCPKEKNSYKHPHGYDLCLACAEKQLQFDELNGLATVER